LWRDRLLVSIAPAAVSWVRLGRGRPRVLAKRTVEADPEFGAAPWDGALAALRAEGAAWCKDALTVTVVVSNHFARYVIVPPSPGLHGTEEARALARFHFARVHGERSREWEVRLDDSRAQVPRLACAVDADLLEALRACFPASATPRLASVQPYLMAAYNRWRSAFPLEGAWFLMVEPERACLALIVRERWLAVQNLRGAYDHADTWSELVEREHWRTNTEYIPETVLVHAPRGGAAPLRGAHWKDLITGTFWPDGVSLPADAHYGAALTAS
jgi:hypothetical protein